jgi:CDP-paratose 2-epimerase
MGKCHKENRMRILITGHCGFIGGQAWQYFSEKGFEVWGLDNLSRPTSIWNSSPRSIRGDVNDISTISELDLEFDFVLHLAAQVSVVDAERDAYADFMSNARGTFSVVQFAKLKNAGLIYSSTNKVFGELANVVDPIRDSQQIAPETNYGVSKCSGAHYVRDYSKGFVLHQSCIYGEAQVGDENQGWIGWIRQRVNSSMPITCFGDGSQVRDLLHVEDLIMLYEMIMQARIEPGAYVVGGGAENAFSFAEVVELFGGQISEYSDWRPHDQKFFVSANEGLLAQGWKPNIMFRDKINELRKEI